MDANEARITKLADKGNKKAKKALVFFDKLNQTVARLQIILVFLEVITAGFGALLIHSVIKTYEIFSYETLSLITGLILLCFIIHMFGIIIPKKVTSQKAEKVMFSLLWLINISYYLCMPFEIILSFIGSLILKPFGITTDTTFEEEEVTEEDIRFMVDMGSETGAIEPDEKKMIHNIFELNDTPVRDIMTHRTDAVFLWKEDGLVEWEKTINEKNHSIYPVCGDSVDDIVGIVKTSSFYKYLRKTRNDDNIDLTSIIKEAYFVPESIKADDLFRQMQHSRKHFAIVLDEYGGLAGIITMSDLLEEIVGDLDNDTESVTEEEIIRIDDNTWKILGSTDIDLVCEELNIDLPVEEYNTFAGLILSELGAIPDDGTTAELEAFGLQIKITLITEHRIEETLVCKIEPEIKDE